MRIVCMSDTHRYPIKDVEIPDGDVLIVSGDLTMQGHLFEVIKAGTWLKSLPHKHKIVVAGNHDFLFEDNRLAAEMAIGNGMNGIVYLQDEYVVIDGVKFYGSPWSMRFFDWAFQRDSKNAHIWSRIPDDTDVLITHGPAKFRRDGLPDGSYVGDPALTDEILRVKPKVHVFGHIHYSYGYQHENGTLFVNAAICDERYSHVNEPIVVDLVDGIATVHGGDKASTGTEKDDVHAERG